MLHPKSMRQAKNSRKGSQNLCIAPYTSSIQFIFVVVMSTARVWVEALVSPPLGGGLQLIVPHLDNSSQGPGDSSQCLSLTSFLMLAAPGWPGSSPLATRLLSSLCLSRIIFLPSAVRPWVLVWLLHCEEGPWVGILSFEAL